MLLMHGVNMKITIAKFTCSVPHQSTYNLW